MKAFLILLLFSIPALAHDRHYEKPSPQEIKGIASAIAASQHNFDMGTYSWQGSVGIGGINGNDAISFGMGKRPCEDCPLFNGSVGIEEGKTSFGAGITWRFK